MEIKSARSVSAFNRLGGNGKPAKNQVCKYWLEGRCYRVPCRFLHSLPSETEQCRQPPQPHNIYSKQQKNHTWRNPNHDVSNKVSRPRNGGTFKTITDQEKVSLNTGHIDQPKVETVVRDEPEKNIIRKAQPKQCEYLVNDNSVHGEKCTDLHSWFTGSGFTMLGKLEGHKKAISGIALPSSSDKLYTGSTDGNVRIWDCNTAQCDGSVMLNGEVRCLVAEGPWLFAGLHNVVKAWNLQNQTEFSLDGPGGLVCSIVIDEDKVFAGMEDGTILVWKWNSESNLPEPACTMKGHGGAVGALIIGAGRLYSGSNDCAIKVWDLQNLQCIQTLYGHTKEVTSLLCWDKYLLSASLDKTLKFWHSSESGAIVMAHEIKEEYELMALCGMHDAEVKPILICSFSDATVCLYDLTSFTERGRIFSKYPVQVIQIGVEGHFFTGDAAGEVSVWKLTGEPCATVST